MALKLELTDECVSPEVMSARNTAAMQAVIDDDARILNHFFRMTDTARQELAGMLAERVYISLHGGSQL